MQTMGKLAAAISYIGLSFGQRFGVGFHLGHVGDIARQNLPETDIGKQLLRIDIVDMFKRDAGEDEIDTPEF